MLERENMQTDSHKVVGFCFSFVFYCAFETRSIKQEVGTKCVRAEND